MIDSDKKLETLRLKAKLADSLPFCPDHRDKVADKPCRECKIEQLLKQNEKLTEIVDSLTRCRRCGYYPFIIEKDSRASCPKCNVLHIR